MNISRRFILGIVAFIVLVFILQLQMPRKFVWKFTAQHSDDEPFGAMIFDSLAKASMPNGYAVDRRTFYQMAHAKDSMRARNYLLIGDDLDLDSLNIACLLRFAERGSTVMLVASTLPSIMDDTLHIYTNGSTWFRLDALKNQILRNDSALYDTLHWTGMPERFPPATYKAFATISGYNLTTTDSLRWTTLAYIASYIPTTIEDDVTASEDDATASEDSVLTVAEAQANTIASQTDAVVATNDAEYNNSDLGSAAIRPWGKGQIIVVTSNYLFTNYGILDSETRPYIFRLLSMISDKPVVRKEFRYQSDGELAQEMSPLRYFFSQPPLLWAWRLTLAAILLFLVFTARRRQRVIPEYHSPANKQLEFVQLIGTLYHQRGDTTDIVRKKYLYTAERLRRNYGVDIEDTTDDARTFAVLARQTGLDAEWIARLVRDLRAIYFTDYDIEEKKMKHYIDQMNKLWKKE